MSKLDKKATTQRRIGCVSGRQILPEASFEKRRHSSQKQQVGGPAHYSSTDIDSVPKATLRRHGKNSCSMAGCLLDLFFEHGAFSDLMRIM